MIAQEQTMKTCALVAAYQRHNEWAKRSGYAPVEWSDFKASRLSNPLALAAIRARAQEVK